MDSENTVRFLYCGDSSLSVEFGNEISPDINNRIRCLTDMLEKKPIRGISECIPTYRSLLISYNPSVLSGERLIKKLNKYIPHLTADGSQEKRIFVIPVCYDGEFAPDMDNVCKHADLSKEEVIKIHCGKDYLIYMLGFLPGFPYLGGLDERIHTPRLESPRTSIPAGSVGIGGKQTGIYPLASPGGWQLIGRTPVKPYDPERAEPIIYSAGDYIRFRPVPIDEYHEIKEKCDSGLYEFEVVKE